MKSITLLLGLLIATTAFSQTNTWTGTVDRDWHKSCNWSLSLVPTCAHDIVIPNTTNKPKVTGIAHCKTINVASASGAYLEVASSTGGIVYVSSTNGGACSGTATDNSASGCCTPWGVTQSLTSNHMGESVAVDANAVYAVGYHTPSGSPSSGTGNEWYIQKRNLTTGAFITSASYGSTNTGFGTNQDIAYNVQSDGTNIYVAGMTLQTAWRMDRRNASDLAVNVTGVNYTTNSFPPGNSIMDAVIDNTHMYIVGVEGSSNYNWRIQKRNLSNCVVANTWTRDFVGGTTLEVAYGVAVDATYIYVIGLKSNSMWRLEQINKSTGTTVWGIDYDPSGQADFGLDVAVDATGVYVVGVSDNSQSNPNLIIQKRSLADGSLIWTQSTTGNTQIGRSYAHLAVSATGLYVTTFNSTGGEAWKVQKRDLNSGALLCTGTAIGGASLAPRASGLAISAAGIFAVGSEYVTTFRIEKMCCP